MEYENYHCDIKYQPSLDGIKKLNMLREFARVHGIQNDRTEHGKILGDELDKCIELEIQRVISDLNRYN